MKNLKKYLKMLFCKMNSKLNMKKLLTPPLIERSHIKCQFCSSYLSRIRTPKILFDIRIPFTFTDVSVIKHSKSHKLFCNECNYYKPVSNSFILY